ncbi:protein Hook homolog 3 isoform X2 [Myripristis murdjan]|uniref:protein Hook homolog 3 isoform X2 n=1 Tax=Myripristis murdjan TaxID=586833 RepID=UPI0011760957|nr:protein Hook homolog 3-like isoform X2 [Myripristis murdjan]
MRRFFRAHRDEDYSQIQYLTAKCSRLAYEKAVLDRECLVARERERRLQGDLEAVAARLLQQEQLNMELRTKHDQVVSVLHQQKELVDFLRQRVVLLAEASCRDAELLQQVSSELQCLQGSELQLEGLVDELHSEAQRSTALTESLQAELRRKTVKLEQLQSCNKTLAEELEELCSVHRRKVRELQRENKGSLKKLQETAEQFEWLCEQQRYWICCVKRFRDCLTEEKEALVQQVNRLEKKVAELSESSLGDGHTQTLHRPLQDTECCKKKGITLWDADDIADLQSEVDESNKFYEELLSQTGSAIDRHQKPP